MSKVLLLIATLFFACFDKVHSNSSPITAVSGVTTNINIICSIEEETETFWMINGSLYGLLHAPNEFEVCHERTEGNIKGNCDLSSLRIQVVQSEMDGYTFQCVGIDYNTNTHHLGTQTELSVITLTSSEVESLNSKLVTSCY